MSFLWPAFLLLLGLIPVLVAVYIWMLRRRRFAVRFSSLSLVRQALPRYSRLRRHLPFGLFLLALASLVIGFSRPVSIVTVPTGQATVILAIDVSRSMCSTDILPNRLKAAEAAALSFTQHQKSVAQIGIVAFADYAELIQPPTTDQETLQASVESLITGRRTAMGSGILKSLDAIAEIDKNVAPSTNEMTGGIKPTPVPKGAYAPDIIVLLTDGASNTGPLPLEAARQASDRGVRVYTIGFGTEQNGSVPNCGQQSQNGNLFGGLQFGGNPQLGGSLGGGFRRGLDEETLKQIADITGGTYHLASSAGELHSVFQSLPTYLILKHETMDISVGFAAAGALLATIAIVLSFLWHPWS